MRRRLIAAGAVGWTTVVVQNDQLSASPRQPPSSLPHVVPPVPPPVPSATPTASSGALQHSPRCPRTTAVHKLMLEKLHSRAAQHPGSVAKVGCPLPADARACQHIVAKKSPRPPFRTCPPMPFQQSPNQQHRRKRMRATQPLPPQSANALRLKAKEAAMAARVRAYKRPQRIVSAEEKTMAAFHAAQTKAAATPVVAHAPACLVHDSHASACTCAYHAAAARIAGCQNKTA